MPTYKDPRHGVSLSEALHEAAAVAPITRTMLNTFELYHSSLPDGPIYVVNDRQAFSAVKEADASRDPGATVEFLACPVQVTRPEESDASSTPEATITVGNVSGVMSDALRAARGSLDPWEIVERVYAADDPSGPAILPPTSFLLTGVAIDPDKVTLTASYGDPANVSVPRSTFKRSEYPGLVR